MASFISRRTFTIEWGVCDPAGIVFNGRFYEMFDQATWLLFERDDGVILIDQNRALAGNVTPADPPGFPVIISLSGSYRLTGNLTVPNANTDAIDIVADNVTIDLNGFSIIGPVVCNGFGAPVTSCSPAAT